MRLNRIMVLLLLVAAPLITPTWAGAAGASSCQSLSSVTLSATSVVATSSVRATVRLRCKVSRATTVRLGGTAGLQVPPAVVVRRGARSATVKVRTLPTTVTRRDTVRAAVRGTRRAAALSVRTGCGSRITGFTAPAGLHAGERANGTVTLGCAPASDVTVTLASDDSVLTVPARVTVRAGRASVAVPVTATLAYGDQHTGHLTARYAGASRSRSVLITPGLQFIEIPASSTPNSVSLNVALTGSAPAGGLVVSVKSSDPVVTAPATFTIPQYASGVVRQLDVGAVSEDTMVTISVTLGSRTLSASTLLLGTWNPETDEAHINPPEGKLYGLRQQVAFSVGIDHPAPEGGVPVSWQVRNNDPAFTFDWTSDTISAGHRYVSFTGSVADVTQTTTIHVDATVGGKQVSIPVTIEPRLLSLTVPSHVQSGSSFSGTINVAGPSTSDRTFYLSQSWGIVDIDPWVVIPAGQTSAIFHGSTAPGITDPSVVQLYATDGSDFEPDEVESNPMTVGP